MKCQKCGGKFKFPLLLSHGNGGSLCPLCKQDPIAQEALYVTKQNEELFQFAEYSYLQWLISKHTAKDQKQFLEPAVKYCSQAAAAGNPRATMRLGFFYDKDYVGLDLGEVQRCRFAYNLYWKVISHRDDFSGEGGILNYSDQASRNLKRETAHLLIEMLRNAPAELAEKERYQLGWNLKKIASLLPKDDVPTPEGVAESATVDVATQIGNLLRGLSDNKVHNPLFGFFHLKFGSVKALLLDRADEKKTSRQLLIEKLYREGITLGYFPCEGDGAANKSYLLTNSGLLKQSATGDEEKVWLFFLNGTGERRFIKKPSDLKKVFDKLTESHYLQLRNLIMNSKLTYCTCFEDDVYCYFEGGLNGWGKALEKLNEHIGNNG